MAKTLRVLVEPNTDAKLCGAVLIRAPREGTTGGAALEEEVVSTSMGDSHTVITPSMSTKDIIKLY